MTAEQDLPDELDDLLPAVVEQSTPSKNGAVPLKRTQRQIRAAEKAEQKRQLALAQTAAQQQAARLAQIVNLHIAGYSLAEIGAKIGATADEVDRMLAQDAARYVRSQPALRVYVRNYISEKYTHLLDAVWTEATDSQHPEKLEHQDRALRILKELARLHGAEAPSQAEVTIDAAPEAVDRIVQALAASHGQGYDDSVFDVVDAEIVHDAVIEAHDRTTVSGNAVGVEQEDDQPL